ncbi:hypothetical protein EBZ39_08735 [bacterium]|nr:hypothetical protein [bacterium]
MKLGTAIQEAKNEAVNYLCVVQVVKHEDQWNFFPCRKGWLEGQTKERRKQFMLVAEANPDGNVRIIG